MIVIRIATMLLLPLGFSSSWLPEYTSLTEEEQLEFQDRIPVDGEYESDVLTYRKPLAWETTSNGSDLVSTGNPRIGNDRTTSDSILPSDPSRVRNLKFDFFKLGPTSLDRSSIIETTAISENPSPAE